LKETTLSSNGRGYVADDGRLGIWTPAPALLVFHIVGHGHRDFARPILEEFDRLRAAGGAIHVFGDLERLPNYDSELRINATEHFRAHLVSMASLHVLVKSRLVAMGVAVANLALHGLVTTHATREPFLRALDHQLREQRAKGFTGSVLET
jgi:hypothetical protein